MNRQYGQDEQFDQLFGEKTLEFPMRGFHDGPYSMGGQTAVT
jgi:hypothetical protein